MLDFIAIMFTTWIVHRWIYEKLFGEDVTVQVSRKIITNNGKIMTQITSNDAGTDFDSDLYKKQYPNGRYFISRQLSHITHIKTGVSEFEVSGSGQWLSMKIGGIYKISNSGKKNHIYVDNDAYTRLLRRHRQRIPDIDWGS